MKNRKWNYFSLGLIILICAEILNIWNIFLNRNHFMVYISVRLMLIMGGVFMFIFSVIKLKK